MASAESARPDIFLPGGQPRRECLTEAAAQVLCEAVRLTRETNWESVRSPHLFMGLLAVPDAGVRMWGERLGADLAKLLSQFQELFQQDAGASAPHVALNREFLSDNVMRLVREAYLRAVMHKRSTVAPMDILITMFTTNNSLVAECFERIGVTAAKLTELAVLAEQQTAQT
jgi:ATP-dependent Clp protease ATP-binding subunit ClpA